MLIETEITERIKRLQGELTLRNIDAALILQKTDIYYFSGTFDGAMLYVPFDRDPVHVATDIEGVKKESSIKDVIPFLDFAHVARFIRNHQGKLPRKLGLEMDILPTRLYLEPKLCKRTSNLFKLRKSYKKLW